MFNPSTGNKPSSSFSFPENQGSGALIYLKFAHTFGRRTVKWRTPARAQESCSGISPPRLLQPRRSVSLAVQFGVLPLVVECAKDFNLLEVRIPNKKVQPTSKYCSKRHEASMTSLTAQAYTQTSPPRFPCLWDLSQMQNQYLGLRTPLFLIRAIRLLY